MPLLQCPDSPEGIQIIGREHAWKLPIALPELRRALQDMLNKGNSLRPQNAVRRVELLLTRDGEMASWNRQAMDCLGPTNILSFPAESHGQGSSLRGSGECGAAFLILSTDAVRREALLFRQHAAEHLVRLLAHGIGHLFGYEHGQDMDAFCLAVRQACSA